LRPAANNSRHIARTGVALWVVWPNAVQVSVPLSSAAIGCAASCRVARSMFFRIRSPVTGVSGAGLPFWKHGSGAVLSFTRLITLTLTYKLSPTASQLTAWAWGTIRCRITMLGTNFSRPMLNDCNLPALMSRRTAPSVVPSIFAVTGTLCAARLSKTFSASASGSASGGWFFAPRRRPLNTFLGIFSFSCIWISHGESSALTRHILVIGALSSSCTSFIVPKLIGGVTLENSKKEAWQAAKAQS
jgi:hypothetical protein